tara:strand:- start:446 stop:1183 length:738 start_codon:yes stop_codon:yes gene_type:complete
MSFSVKKVGTTTLSSDTSEIAFTNIPTIMNYSNHGSGTLGSTSGWWMEVEFVGQIVLSTQSSRFISSHNALTWRAGNSAGTSYMTGGSDYNQAFYRTGTFGNNTGGGNALIQNNSGYSFDRQVNNNAGDWSYDYVPSGSSDWGSTKPYVHALLKVHMFDTESSSPYQPEYPSRSVFSIAGTGGQTASSGGDSDWQTSSYNSTMPGQWYGNFASFKLMSNSYYSGAQFASGSQASLYLYHNNNSQT